MAKVFGKQKTTIEANQQFFFVIMKSGWTDGCMILLNNAGGQNRNNDKTILLMGQLTKKKKLKISTWDCYYKFKWNLLSLSKCQHEKKLEAVEDYHDDIRRILY